MNTIEITAENIENANIIGTVTGNARMAAGNVGTGGLTKNDNGLIEYFSNRIGAAWHRDGQQGETANTVEELQTKSGLNWDVAIEPLYSHGKNVGEFIREEHYVIKRMDNLTSLGYCGGRRDVLQHAEVLEIVQPLVDSGVCRYATAGSLFGGQKCFVQLEFVDDTANQLIIPGEYVNAFLMFSYGFDNLTPNQLSMQFIRVCCQNTFEMAVDKAINKVTFRNTTNMRNRLMSLQHAIDTFGQYKLAVQDNILRLMGDTMSLDEMRDFTKALIGKEEKEDAKRKSSRNANTQEEIVSLFSRGRGNLGATAWDAYNAVTEYTNHNQSGRLSEGAKESDQWADRILFGGSGAKLNQRALDLLMTREPKAAIAITMPALENSEPLPVVAPVQSPIESIENVESTTPENGETPVADTAESAPVPTPKAKSKKSAKKPSKKK